MTPEHREGENGLCHQYRGYCKDADESCCLQKMAYCDDGSGAGGQEASTLGQRRRDSMNRGVDHEAILLTMKRRKTATAFSIWRRKVCMDERQKHERISSRKFLRKSCKKQSFERSMRRARTDEETERR